MGTSVSPCVVVSTLPAALYGSGGAHTDPSQPWRDTCGGGGGGDGINGVRAYGGGVGRGGDGCAHSPVFAVCVIMTAFLGALLAGLTLVHFSAQLERLLWDRGCAWGLCSPCERGIRGCIGWFCVSGTAQAELRSGRV
jgi:hypothetical protein